MSVYTHYRGIQRMPQQVPCCICLEDMRGWRGRIVNAVAHEGLGQSHPLHLACARVCIVAPGAICPTCRHPVNEKSPDLLPWKERYASELQQIKADFIQGVCCGLLVVPASMSAMCYFLSMTLRLNLPWNDKLYFPAILAGQGILIMKVGRMFEGRQAVLTRTCVEAAIGVAILSNWMVAKAGVEGVQKAAIVGTAALVAGIFARFIQGIVAELIEMPGEEGKTPSFLATAGAITFTTMIDWIPLIGASIEEARAALGAGSDLDMATESEMVTCMHIALQMSMFVGMGALGGVAGGWLRRRF